MFAVRDADKIANLYLLKYDLQVLKTAGLDVIHSKAKILDTMIAAWILNPDKTENGSKASFSLEKLAETKLGLIGTEFDSIVKKGQTFMDLDVETATPYAAEDADFTLKLWNYFEPQIFSNATNPKLKDLFDLEMKILPILTEMEINGIHIEKSILEEYKVELEKKAKSAEKDIYELSGKEFNIASPKQLGKILPKRIAASVIPFLPRIIISGWCCLWKACTMYPTAWPRSAWVCIWVSVPRISPPAWRLSRLWRAVRRYLQ